MSTLGPILAWGRQGGSPAGAVRLPAPSPLPRRAQTLPAVVEEGVWVSRTHRPGSAVSWEWMRVPHSASEKGELGAGVGGGR